MKTDAKAAEYERLMSGRRLPAGLWEKWSRVDGKPVRRVMPGFMVPLERRTDFHKPGSPANLAQKAEAFGAEAVVHVQPRPLLRRVPPPRRA